MTCLIGVSVENCFAGNGSGNGNGKGNDGSGGGSTDGVAASAPCPAPFGSRAAPRPNRAVTETPAIILSRLFRRIEVCGDIFLFLNGDSGQFRAMISQAR